jgi:tetratricopeptide (TPR) repeat protein
VSVRLVIISLVAVVILGSETAEAQRSAEAAKLSNSRQGAELAAQSLVLLRQGEDATDPTVKRRSYEDGLELARQAVAADDFNADAHFAVFAHMGRLMMADGVVANPIDLLRVNRELDRTLELNPRHSDALGAKGGMYRQLPVLLGGSLTKAERFLKEAIASDPQAVGARIELARTYTDMGKPEQGVPLLETAATIARQQGKTRQLGDAERLLAEIRRSQVAQSEAKLFK